MTFDRIIIFFFATLIATTSGGFFPPLQNHSQTSLKAFSLPGNNYIVQIQLYFLYPMTGNQLLFKESWLGTFMEYRDQNLGIRGAGQIVTHEKEMVTFSQPT